MIRGAAVRAVSVLCALLVLSLCQLVAAADLRFEVGARVVGVGQAFQVRATVSVDGDEEPASPRLRVQGDAQVQGPTSASQRSIVMHNFSVKSEQSVVFTWIVVPRKVGKLQVGPVSVTVGNRTLRDDAQTVEVVEQPQRRQRRGLFGRDPFGNDPFGPLGKDPFGNDPFGSDPFDRSSRVRPAPDSWKLPHAADPVAFLHATLSKDKVVLGEPVRLTVLAYGSRGEFFEQQQSSPSLADFVSFPVQVDPIAEPLYQTELDGTRFFVRKIREFIIVPLKTGTLSVGDMSTVLQSRRGSYPASGNARGMKVASLPLQLSVVDTPDKGKPDGYFPGDVGRYELKAQVSPRRVEQGQYVQVLVSVQGRGYVPSKVLLPEDNALVWNTPTVRGEPSVTDDVLGGERTLDYSVQAVKAGHVELGVVRLPYYDEEKRRYRVAKVDLGAIDVEAKPASKNSAQPSSPPEISEVPIELSPRRKLEAIPQEPRRVPPWAWMIVLLSPLGALVVRAIGAGVSSLSVRREKRAKRDARHHLDLAQAEIAQGNSQAALSSLERALFAGVFEATSVRARGILRESLSGELQNAGLPKSLCERVTRQLGDLEAARYGQGTRDTAELAATANELVAELHKFRSVRRKS